MKKNTGIRSSNRLQLVFIPLLIVVFTYICFSPALRNGFTNWDDNAYVFENPHLKQPLSKAIGYFFGPHYFIGNYIPVTMIVYALEYHAAGLKPHVFHAVNLLLHLVNVLLVFRFAYLLSNKKVIAAAVVALFFGIHPMHVESVAWIAELKDVLYTAFFMLSLIVYLRYLEAKRWQTLGLVFLLFIAAVLSKPAAIILPLILWLLDFYTKRTFDFRCWLEKLPFVTASVIFSWIAVKAQEADHLLHTDHTLVQKFFFACHSLLAYLAKCLAPLHLSNFYPYPRLVNGQLPLVYYLSPLLLMVLCYGVYRSLKRSRLIAFGCLFFAVNLLLVLQLVSVGDAVMAERYTYVSYTGLFFIVGIYAEDAYSNAASRFNSYRAVLLGSLAVLALVFSVITYQRCKVWLNDDTIATNLLSNYPDDRLALNNKGFILMEQGRYADAVPLLSKAIQLKPDYTMASINLCNAYLSLNDPQHALETIDAALIHAPEDPNLLFKKGLLLSRQSRCVDALPFYKRVIALRKSDVNAYMNLAECYYNLKQYQEGLTTLDAALALEPANYVLLNNKGYILFVMGRYNEAIPYFNESLRIQPDYQTARVNLANCNKAMTELPSLKAN